MRLVICLPSSDMVYAEHADCLMQAVVTTLQKGNHRVVSVIRQKSAMIQVSRCELIERAKEYKPDAVIFIDSDQIFPHDTFDRLADSGKDIIGCNIVQRRPPFQSNTEGLDGKRINEERTGVERVSRIGTGLLFVKMDVFNAYEQPYFRIDLVGDRWQGEDFFFCMQAKKRGFHIFVDHDLSKEVFHIGTYPFGLANAQKD